jgi:hypothetical protein
MVSFLPPAVKKVLRLGIDFAHDADILQLDHVSLANTGICESLLGEETAKPQLELSDRRELRLLVIYRRSIDRVVECNNVKVLCIAKRAWSWEIHPSCTTTAKWPLQNAENTKLLVGGRRLADPPRWGPLASPPGQISAAPRNFSKLARDNGLLAAPLQRPKKSVDI